MTPMKPLGLPITTEAAALEALFAQDAMPGLSHPAKLTKEVAAALIEKGWAREWTWRVSVRPVGAMTVAGHRITAAGHLAYCQSCGEDDDERI